MKWTALKIVVIFIMSFNSTELNWIIEPKYQEIIVYGENSFVAKINDVYKILDYSEEVLYEFTNKEILGIGDHPNEGGELQEIIHVNYLENKSRLFNINTLRYLHEERYYYLQTEDYYEPERRLIRVFDNLKEGVMDFDGNLILPPIYEGVSVAENYSLGFGENEITVYDNLSEKSKIISYYRLNPQHIASKSMILIHRIQTGSTNVHKEIMNHSDGFTRITYEEAGEFLIHCGVVDINDNVIIPFDYSSLIIKNNDYLEFTKEEKITERGIPIFEPKKGIIDFENNIILNNEYKYIGTVEGSFVQVQNFENKRAIYNLAKRKFESEFIYETYDEAAIKLAELDNNNPYLKFEDNGLVGMKDKSGKTIIPAKYSSYHKTTNPNIYTVNGSTEDEYGYEGYYHIDLNEEIVPTKFSDRGGIGGHKRNNQNNVIKTMDPETGKIGFYRIDGLKIADPIYDEFVEGFSEDLAPVYEEWNKGTGMINIEGEIIYDFIFDSMTLPYNNKSIVGYKGKYGILKLK